MGRYISGDIDRKLWFGVQASDAADRFGVQGEHPNYLDYHFFEDDLPGVTKEIKKIEQSIDVKKMDDFFLDPNRNGYTQDDLDKREITHRDLEEYADLCLGRDIQKCIADIGECSFTAEL